ncbi:MAG: hypothetical protein P8N02_00935 [Actinomycetota bacterium]|nr:hypothetical protein [Actinomycetota bacterium]
MQVREMDHIVLNVTVSERHCGVTGPELSRYADGQAAHLAFVSPKVSESCIVDLFDINRSGEPRTLWQAEGNGPSLTIYYHDRNRVELRRDPTR